MQDRPHDRPEDKHDRPEDEATVRYTRGQSKTEEADQTQRMPRSRIRHGVIVTLIALAVAIAAAVVLSA